MKRNLERTIVCIVGLGYVGLPLAEAFSRSFKVIGFDTLINLYDSQPHLNHPLT